MARTRQTNDNNTNKKSSDTANIKAKTAIGKDGLTYTGAICFTPDGGIVIDLTKSECAPSAVREVTKRTLKGADVSFKVGNTVLSEEDFDDLDADVTWHEERIKELKKLLHPKVNVE